MRTFKLTCGILAYRHWLNIPIGGNDRTNLAVARVSSLEFLIFTENYFLIVLEWMRSRNKISRQRSQRRKGRGGGSEYVWVASGFRAVDGVSTVCKKCSQKYVQVHFFWGGMCQQGNFAQDGEVRVFFFFEQEFNIEFFKFNVLAR